MRRPRSLVSFLATLAFAAPAAAQTAPVNPPRGPSAPLTNAAPASAGPATSDTPLRIHPENPRLFLFRGKPTVLLGSSEHYGAVLNLDFDYRVYLDELADKGLNLTRTFMGSYVEKLGAFGIQKNNLAPASGRFIAPWARSDKPGYAGGGNKFDLDKWDAAYFARLKDFVAEAGKRGIVVEVTLFSSLYGEDGWKWNPFHPSNNVNGTKAVDRKKVHTLDNGGLLVYQEKLVRKIVSELRGADNVYYEIQNEPWPDQPVNDAIWSQATPASRAWQRRIAAVITAEESAMPGRHLIAENVSNRSTRVTEPDPNVSIFNFHYTRPPDAVRINADLGRVVGFNETGFDGPADATYRQQAWRFLLAGGGLYNNLDYSFTVDRENGTDTQKAPGGGSPALRAQLGTLRRFLLGFGDDLPRLAPTRAFVRAGGTPVLEAMAAPGRAWAVYLAGGKPDGKRKTLALELPMGAHTVEWIDPVGGRALASERIVHAGGTLSLAVPAFEEDLALRVRRASTLATLAELPAASSWTATSPNGRAVIGVVLADLDGVAGAPAGKRLYYQVEHGDAGARQVVIPWSPLGVEREDEGFVDGLSFVSQTGRGVNERYTLLRGKARDISARGNERTIVLETARKSRFEVILRAYDDGVAFRYRFPDKRDGTFVVRGETTGFRIPAGATGALTPHSNPGKWTPAYEEYWEADVPAGTPSRLAAGWSFPALFQIGARWALLTEAGLDGSYVGSRLAPDAPDGLYRVRFPDGLEGEGLGDTEPRATLPWDLPWRVIVIGETLAPIVETNLVTHLAPPSKIKDTRWIKPGRSAWSWWAESDSPKHYEQMVPFIDLAADMGWEYFLVDANWDEMKGKTWKDLAAYAKNKNVRLLLWYNSGGENNFVSEKVRDRMFERDKRREEMKMLAEAGVAGIKVDFFQSDKQIQIQEYLGILEDAAEFKLLVNFHGCTIPRGWERTWPNLMGHEAVRGAELYKFNDSFSTRAPAHNTILPFARNAIGPMDYTPVTFTHSKYKHSTTNAHELALSVVFENGLQHFADGVQAYRSLPEAPRTFLKAVPAVWDETRYVAGQPGRLAVLARRSGKEWFVGGISGAAEATEVTIPLDRFGKGGRWNVMVIADGADDASFQATTEARTAADTLKISVRPRGGFVVRAVPAR